MNAKDKFPYKEVSYSFPIDRDTAELLALEIAEYRERRRRELNQSLFPTCTP